MNIKKDSIIKRTTNQVLTKLDNEIVILDIDSEEYISVEGVGIFIYELIEKPISVDEILENLLKEYEVSPEECEKDLFSFLNSLLEKGLIEIK